jgi:hypothetical protein
MLWQPLDCKCRNTAANSRDLLRMAYADFARLVEPIVLDFARETTAAAAGWGWGER